MRVCLDTNTYRLFMDSDTKAIEIIRTAETVFMPIPVLAELKCGFSNGTRGKQNEAFLVKFLDSSRVHLLKCDEHTAQYYAQLKLQLKKQGTPIPINDIWIAALALQYRLPLYTMDSDFDHIPQLARVG